jgi:hypothetical protein
VGNISPPFFGLHFRRPLHFFSREKGDEMLQKPLCAGSFESEVVRKGVALKEEAEFGIAV